MLGTGSRGLCLFSVGTQSTGETDSKKTHRHLWAVSDAKEWCEGDIVLGKGVYLYSDNQRPLGRMRSELPHERGKRDRHWKIKGRSRAELVQEEGTACGDTLRTEPGLSGGTEKAESMTAVWMLEGAGERAKSAGLPGEELGFYSKKF